MKAYLFWNHFETFSHFCILGTLDYWNSTNGTSNPTLPPSQSDKKLGQTWWYISNISFLKNCSFRDDPRLLNALLPHWKISVYCTKYKYREKQTSKLVLIISSAMLCDFGFLLGIEGAAYIKTNAQNEIEYASNKQWFHGCFYNVLFY